MDDKCLDLIAECRNAAGFGGLHDPMTIQGQAALGSPDEVPAFIREQFKRFTDRETKLRELVEEWRLTFKDEEILAESEKGYREAAHDCADDIEAILDRESNDQAANKLAREQGFDGCNDYYIGRNKPNPTEDN